MGAEFDSRREHAIFAKLIAALLVCTLILPLSTTAQSGDATWLDDVNGLELAIGRSWTEPMPMPVDEAQSTPAGEARFETRTLSALVYEFHSAEHAAEGLELFNAEQEKQIERDPNNPAAEAFSPDLGDAAYGHEGEYEIETLNGDSMDVAVVYLLVQDDTYVYQVFGQFVPGNHVGIATGVAEAMIAADAGDTAPMYDMNGASTGGLWEKLNAVEVAMPEGSGVFDLEIYPPADDAVAGNSVVVPPVELDQLGEVPGLVGSWYIAYAPVNTGTPVATPVRDSTGAFSIEVWVMEFEDSTHASAAAFSLNATLTEPLGIVNSDGGFGSSEDEGITLVNTGFVRDDSLPDGDAAVVVQARGTTVYAARVYTRDLAPTPVAERLVAHVQGTAPGEGDAADTELVPSDDRWDYFPQAGDDVLYGLVPVVVRYDTPSAPPATPVG